MDHFLDYVGLGQWGRNYLKSSGMVTELSDEVQKVISDVGGAMEDMNPFLGFKDMPIPRKFGEILDNAAKAYLFAKETAIENGLYELDYSDLDSFLESQTQRQILMTEAATDYLNERANSGMKNPIEVGMAAGHFLFATYMLETVKNVVGSINGDVYET